MADDTEPLKGAHYYQAFMDGAAKNMWHLVNLVARFGDQGNPLTVENYKSRLQGGDPCAVLISIRRDFDGLAQRVKNDEFIDIWKEEMTAASAVWKTWHEPNNEYSWLLPQAEFTDAFWQFHKRWSDGSTWRVVHATGLRDGVRVNMTNEPFVHRTCPGSLPQLPSLLNELKQLMSL